MTITMTIKITITMIIMAIMMESIDNTNGGILMLK